MKTAKHFLSLLLCLIIAGAAGGAPAIGCDAPEPSEAIQKYLVSKAVENTEKQGIVSVEITAPGLAVVRYGAAAQPNSVRVTFVTQCDPKATPEQIVNNPVGFRVTGYFPVTR